MDDTNSKAGTLPDLVMAKDGRDESIATGGKLTEATFADFVQRLRYHVRGEGVDDHCTADALFVVQSREIIFGIDRDYTDKTAVAIEDSMYFSPQEYWDDHEDMRARLDAAAHEVDEMPFLSLEEYEQWDILAELPEHTVSGWDERWNYVNSHLTKEAAEAFIKRKKHDYRRGLRVYVEAQVYCWEFNQIIGALMDGRITFATPASPASAPEASERAKPRFMWTSLFTNTETGIQFAVATAAHGDLHTLAVELLGCDELNPAKVYEVAIMKRAEWDALAAPLPPVVARKELTNDEILTLCAPYLSDGQGFVRKPELFEIVACARAIEREVAARLAGKPDDKGGDKS